MNLCLFIVMYLRTLYITCSEFSNHGYDCTKVLKMLMLFIVVFFNWLSLMLYLYTPRDHYISHDSPMSGDGSHEVSRPQTVYD